jgi:hypothetical protein
MFRRKKQPQPQRPEYVMNADYFEAVADRPLTDAEIQKIIDAIDYSSVPDAVNEIVFSVVGYAEEV